jgi:hypothetical protein
VALNVQNPDVGSGLQRLYRLVGPVSPALDEHITPVVVVGEVELLTPPGAARAAGASGPVVGGVGTFPTAILTAAPGTVVQIVALTVWANANTHLLVSMREPFEALAGIFAGSFTEGRRLNPFSRPSAELTFGASAGAVASEFARIFLDTTQGSMRIEPKHWCIGQPLLPFSAAGGHHLTIQANTADISMSLSLEWIETLDI